MADKQVQVEKLPTQHTDDKFGVSITNLPEVKEIFTNGTLDNLEQMEAAPINIATQYYDFKRDEPVRFVFLGMTEHPTQDGEILPAIVLMDAKGNTYINMAKILVGTFMGGSIRIGQPVEVTWTGDKKVQKGTARIWRVVPLNMPAK